MSQSAGPLPGGADAAPPAATAPVPLAAAAATPAPAAGGAQRRQQARRSLGLHPAHWIALGFGSGLAPWAPGTVGTLWAWAAWVLVDARLGAAATGVLMGWVLLVALPLGWWACTRTAQHLGVADPGAIVWDEVIAFWLVLWLLMPAGLGLQVAAFALFRWFDAAKPGPVGWADRRFKLKRGEAIGWRQGFGILFDDLVAALCTLLVISLWMRLASAG